MTNLPPITAVSMEGFKCFDHLRLELGQLTLLTGFNGGGKSTALQPLLLTAQTLRQGGDKGLALNGMFARLGTAGDIAPKSHKSQEIQTLLEMESQKGAICYYPSLNSGERILPHRKKPKGLNDKHGPLEALQTLSFLGAVRAGPEDAFPIPENIDFPDVGHDGRYAAYWYDRMVDEDVESEGRHYPGLSAITFRRQLDAWFGSLFPGAEANVQNMTDLSQMNLQFRLSELGSWHRPSNTGYGLTYAFPILVALLAAKENQVVIIDSPEAHLHPSAQSQMGRILAHFASAGVQIIVESHSDHLLNGVRLAVQKGTLHHEKLQIHFFKGADGSGHGVISAPIDSKGNIHEWPKGFFDQNEKDLARLAGWE